MDRKKKQATNGDIFADSLRGRKRNRETKAMGGLTQ